MKHTPGPWNTPKLVPYRVDDEFSTVAVCNLSSHTREEAEANARLIAAAPELLEALKGFVEEWDELCMNQLSPAYIAANAAIAKAVSQ